MVIAALLVFTALLIAWLVAPSPGRAVRRDRPVSLRGDLAPEAP